MPAFVLAGPERQATVDRFNQRLRAKGSALGFVLDTPGKEAPETGIRLEKLVSLDAQGEMRAGYWLKHQRYRVGDREESIGNLQIPLSEGIVDRAYAAYGMAIVLDAVKRQPLLYSLGMGGLEEPYPKLLAAMKWRLQSVPFFFKILRGKRFLQRIKFLRTRPERRLLLDLLAKSGIGSLGTRVANRVLTRAAVPRGVRVERVSRLAGADEIWRSGRRKVSLAAVRDEGVLGFLYREARFIRVLVSSGGRPVGWGVGLCTEFQDHKQFGALTVGSLVDGFAELGYEDAVALAASSVVEESGADLIVSNQSHHSWQGALRRAGFLPGPSNFALAISPALGKLLDERLGFAEWFHVNRGDGDGPINL